MDCGWIHGSFVTMNDRKSSKSNYRGADTSLESCCTDTLAYVSEKGLVMQSNPRYIGVKQQQKVMNLETRPDSSTKGKLKPANSWPTGILTEMCHPRIVLVCADDYLSMA